MFGDAMSIFARAARARRRGTRRRACAEQVEVLLDGPIAIRAVAARLGQRAAILADLVGREAVDVGLAALRISSRRTRRAARSSPRRRTLGSSQSNPSQRTSSLIGVDVLDVFLGPGWCRRSAGCSGRRTRGDAEVQADRLGVADVQVAVRPAESGTHAAGRPAGRWTFPE